MSEERNSRKVRKGVVVSDANDKTITVQITERKPHRKYGKMVTSTKKPNETRMGSGKGNPEEWVAVVKPGRIMFEIGGVEPEVAREAMRLAISKLPVKCKMVFKNDPEAQAEQASEGDEAADGAAAENEGGK